MHRISLSHRNKLRLFATYLTSWAFVMSGPVNAANKDPEPTEPKPEETKPASDDCTQVETILKGQPSKCTGIIWPESWSKEAASCLLVDLPAAKKLIEYQRRVCATALETCRKTVEALKDGQRHCKETIREVVAPETAWYEHPAFWGVVGAVVATGATVIGYELSK